MPKNSQVRATQGRGTIECKAPVGGIRIEHLWFSILCYLDIKIRAEIKGIFCLDTHNKRGTLTGMGCRVFIDIAACMQSLSIMDMHEATGANLNGRTEFLVTHEQTRDVEIQIHGNAHRRNIRFELCGPGLRDFKIDKSHYVKTFEAHNMRVYQIHMKN